MLFEGSALLPWGIDLPVRPACLTQDDLFWFRLVKPARAISAVTGCRYWIGGQSPGRQRVRYESHPDGASHPQAYAHEAMVGTGGTRAPGAFREEYASGAIRGCARSVSCVSAQGRRRHLACFDPGRFTAVEGSGCIRPLKATFSESSAVRFRAIARRAFRWGCGNRAGWVISQGLRIIQVFGDRIWGHGWRRGCAID